MPNSYLAVDLATHLSRIMKEMNSFQHGTKQSDVYYQLTDALRRTKKLHNIDALTHTTNLAKEASLAALVGDSTSLLKNVAAMEPYLNVQKTFMSLIPVFAQRDWVQKYTPHQTIERIKRKEPLNNFEILTATALNNFIENENINLNEETQGEISNFIATNSTEIASETEKIIAEAKNEEKLFDIKEFFIKKFFSLLISKGLKPAPAFIIALLVFSPLEFVEPALGFYHEAKLETRFDQVDTKLDQTENNINKLNNKVDKVNSQISNLNNKEDQEINLLESVYKTEKSIDLNLKTESDLTFKRCNLYKNNFASSEISKQLEPEEEVIIIDKKPGWCFIKLKNHLHTKGWIEQANLKSYE